LDLGGITIELVFVVTGILPSRCVVRRATASRAAVMGLGAGMVAAAMIPTRTAASRMWSGRRMSSATSPAAATTMSAATTAPAMRFRQRTRNEHEPTDNCPDERMLDHGGSPRK